MDKEKIFVELREYHTKAFPEKLSTPKMDELREEFTEIEDSNISMLLNLVNGKSVFEDLSSNIDAFKEKIKINKSTDKAEEADRKFFAEKIDLLNGIIAMGRTAVFRLKVPRVAKVVPAKA